MLRLHLRVGSDVFSSHLKVATFNPEPHCKGLCDHRYLDIEPPRVAGLQCGKHCRVGCV